MSSIRIALLIAVIVIGGATPRLSSAQNTEFLGWPRDVASRLPALASGIERDFGERPRVILFSMRDTTMEVFFWNPRVVQSDPQSKQLPTQSIPLVRKAANEVAAFVWANFARETGMKAVNVSFMRVRSENHVLVTQDVPAQEISVFFTHRYLETGTTDLPPVATSLRSGNECTAITAARCLGFSWMVGNSNP